MALEPRFFELGIKIWFIRVDFFLYFDALLVSLESRKNKNIQYVIEVFNMSLVRHTVDHKWRFYRIVWYLFYQNLLINELIFNTNKQAKTSKKRRLQAVLTSKLIVQSFGTLFYLNEKCMLNI